MSLYEEANKDKKRSIVIKETESEAEAEAEYGRLQRSSWRHFIATAVPATCGDFVRKGRPVVVSLYAENSSLSGRLDFDLLDRTRGECHRRGRRGRETGGGGRVEMRWTRYAKNHALVFSSSTLYQMTAVSTLSNGRFRIDHAFK